MNYEVILYYWFFRGVLISLSNKCTRKIKKLRKLDHLRGWGERELSVAIGGGGGGMIPLSVLETRSTTRSWVAFKVATASSCVTFSRFLSPCWNECVLLRLCALNIDSSTIKDNCLKCCQSAYFSACQNLIYYIVNNIYEMSKNCRLHSRIKSHREMSDKIQM